MSLLTIINTVLCHMHVREYFALSDAVINCYGDSYFFVRLFLYPVKTAEKVVMYTNCPPRQSVDLPVCLSSAYTGQSPSAKQTKTNKQNNTKKTAESVSVMYWFELLQNDK